MNQKFYKKYGIIRESIKKDILFFWIPFFSIFLLGLVFSNLNKYGGFFSLLTRLINRPQNVFLLSLQNVFGLFLLIIGLIIMLIAQFTLGRNYSGFLIIRKNHELITHGIYHFIRHPIYLGLIIGILGIPVITSSITGFIVMMLSVPFILIRINIEEELLIAEYGIKYK